MPSAETMEHFEIGRTTYQELTAVLGQPMASTVGSGGIRTVVYSRGNTEIDPMTYVPIIGLFAGGATSEARTITFSFQDDILSDMNYSETSVHVNLGDM